jgi:uncharacterized membrane protein YraQ (UPF0718 family)
MAQAVQVHAYDTKRHIDKRLFVAIAIFLAILVFFLTQSRLPSVFAKFAAADQPLASRTQSTFSQVLDPTAFPAWFRWVAYGVNLWDGNAIGMFFAMLLGGAALSAFSFTPGTRVRQLFTKTGATGAGVGGVFGMPLFMCSACSAPVSLGFWRGGAALETTLGVILGSALFQPVALAAIVLLMPLPMAIARIAFGLALLLGIVPLIARFAQPASACRLPDAGKSAPGLFSGDAGDAFSGPAPTGWAQAFGHAVRAWWRHTLDFALRFAPPMALAGFAVGVVLTIAPPQLLTDLTQTGPLVVIVMALIGTLIQVPGMFEVPLVLAILALGFGAGPATALLLTVPSTGLVTFGITRKELGWKVPALMLLATFVLGTTAGLVVNAL